MRGSVNCTHGLCCSLPQLYAEKVASRGLCAIAQCESLRYKLLGGLAVRRACYGVLRFIMESGAKGCEIVVSGKLRGQRAKSMKFVDGLMIHTGNPTRDYIDKACTHVLLRQGVWGLFEGWLEDSGSGSGRLWKGGTMLGGMCDISVHTALHTCLVQSPS